MQLILNNIGPLKDADLLLDGITVLCGRNSVGKSTVGKIIYSMVNSASLVEETFVEDKRYYLRNHGQRVIWHLATLLQHVDITAVLDKDSVLSKLMGGNDDRFFVRPRVSVNEETLKAVLSELNAIIPQLDNGSITLAKGARGAKQMSAPILIDLLKDYLRQIEDILHKSRSDDIEGYWHRRLQRFFDAEFSRQIQSMGREETISSASLIEDKNSVFPFSVSFLKNSVFEDKRHYSSFASCPFTSAYFVDDPFVIDRLASHEGDLHSEEHSRSLIDSLESQRALSLFEEMIQEDELKRIMDVINSALPGGLVSSEAGDYTYDWSDESLPLNNLAAGCKSFLILKTLLEKGNLESKSILILDEPESHLHPEWVSIYAQAIVLIAKATGCKVILTTHSIHFLLAIETYALKEKIMDKTHFYLGVGSGIDHSFECVDGKLEAIYSDFYESMRKNKELRDSLLVNND